MKKIMFFLCMVMFMNMPCFAETFSAANDDGVSITYETTSDSTVSVVQGESSYAGDIVIPDSVLNDDIWYDVNAIGNYTFYQCTNLITATIPNSVKSIGYRAFENCSALTSVTIGESVKTIGYDAFKNTGLKSVEFPNTLEFIGYHAFDGCQSLESVSFGDSIKTIEQNVFNGCNSLTKVIVNDIAALLKIRFVNSSSNPLSIAKCLYLNEEEVTALEIPEGVTEIPSGVLNGVASFTSLTIPNTVTSIAANAFNGCTNLASVVIPESVTFIGDNAFNGCTNLETVTLPESLIGIDMGKDVFANTAWQNSQSDKIIYVGSVLYKYQGTIPAGTTITVEEGTTHIAEEAFKGQTNLVSITIPESVTHIGKDAFTGTTWYTNQADGPIYINKVLYKYKGTMPANTTIEVTEGTVNIAEGAFENFTQLTGVVLPNTVTTIEKAAFSGCTGLTELTIGDAIATIGDDAFKSCNNLNKIHVSSDDRMFAILYGDAISWGEGQANPFTLAKHIYVGDTEVTEVTLPEDMITEINQGFFHNFGKNVTSLTIPNSVTTIGDAAFQDWTNLASVTIGESVESIGANAFKSCTNLKSIEIPNSVLTIGDRAFESCN